MKLLLIFISAIIIIGFIAFIFVYNFRNTTSEVPPVPPEFDDDFSHDFSSGM